MMSERPFEESGMGLSSGGDLKLECCQRNTESGGRDDG